MVLELFWGLAPQGTRPGGDNDDDDEESDDNLAPQRTRVRDDDGNDE